MKVEFSKSEIQIMQTELEQWGINAQVGQTVEECAELIVALQKYINRTPQANMKENILDEITDVEIHDFRFAKTRPSVAPVSSGL